MCLRMDKDNLKYFFSHLEQKYYRYFAASLNAAVPANIFKENTVKRSRMWLKRSWKILGIIEKSTKGDLYEKRKLFANFLDKALELEKREEVFQ